MTQTESTGKLAYGGTARRYAARLGATGLTLGIGAAVGPAAQAHAQAQLSDWSFRTYPSKAACVAERPQECLVLKDGSAIGATDLDYLFDLIDHLLGLPYKNTATLPASASDPVTEVVNLSQLAIFLGPGTAESQLADERAHQEYAVAADTDEVARTPFDAYIESGSNQSANIPGPKVVTSKDTGYQAASFTQG